MSAVSLIPKDSEPSSPFEVWAPLALLRPDWGSEFSLSSSYNTSVFTGDTGAETRRGLMQRPQRAISYMANNWDIAEQFDLLLFVERLTRSRTLMPIWCDASITTQAAAQNDTRIYCDTTYRRFEVDSWVIAFDPLDGERVITEYQLAEVTAIDDTYIDVSPLSGPVGNNWDIVPTIIVDPVFVTSSDYMTDRHASTMIEVAEAAL